MCGIFLDSHSPLIRFTHQLVQTVQFIRCSSFGHLYKARVFLKKNGVYSSKCKGNFATQLVLSKFRIFHLLFEEYWFEYWTLIRYLWFYWILIGILYLWIFFGILIGYLWFYWMLIGYFVFVIFFFGNYWILIDYVSKYWLCMCYSLFQK